jgi:hypothetical protein
MFKLFQVKYDNGVGVEPLLREIEAWVKYNGVAPKSVGVEYLEGKDILVMSLGYNTAESYPITLTHKVVGKLDLSNLATMEDAISAQASLLQGVICHELFVLDDGTLTLVFMSKA